MNALAGRLLKRNMTTTIASLQRMSAADLAKRLLDPAADQSKLAIIDVRDDGTSSPPPFLLTFPISVDLY
jgi:hypothetical protein